MTFDRDKLSPVVDGCHYHHADMPGVLFTWLPTMGDGPHFFTVDRLPRGDLNLFVWDPCDSTYRDLDGMFEGRDGCCDFTWGAENEGRPSHREVIIVDRCDGTDPYDDESW